MYCLEEIWRKIFGLMDEGYFMDREDKDCRRKAMDAGWQLQFEPQAHK